MAERKERLTVSRRMKMLEPILETSEVLVTELSKEFEVSDVTIRNDLAYLEKNLLIRARGGAIHSKSYVGTHQQLTGKINIIEKVSIEKKAASLIKDGKRLLLIVVLQLLK